MSTSGRDRATAQDRTSESPANQALDLMEQALALMDKEGGPVDAGAHLDLAIHRLKDWIATNKG